jgi:formylglycine-generating enzyme required for sulfatase activity
MIRKTTSWLVISTIIILLTSMSRGLFDREAGAKGSNTNAGSLSIEMIEVPAGSFRMGSGSGDEDETPVHQVSISKPFLMGKYEVTNNLAARVFTWAFEHGKIKEDSGSFVDREGDFKKLLDTADDENQMFFGHNKFSVRPGKENYPCTLITWFGCVKFCNFLSSMENLEPVYSGSGLECSWNANGYRLPTEAEWEYAATGAGRDTTFKYAGSDNPSEVGWFESNEKKHTHPVGEKKPNPLGFYDMSGNAWECCWDLYGYYIPETIDADQFLKSVLIKTNNKEQKDFISKIYKKEATGNSYSLSHDLTNEDNRKTWELFRGIGFIMGPQNDPKGIMYRNKRVLKGGDWGSIEFYLRPSYRGRVLMEMGSTGTGFRIAKNRID